MDVAAWLRDLGLGQYEGAFRESEAVFYWSKRRPIFEELGLPLGPRKRLRKMVILTGTA
jgi:hypothetical protein